MNAKKTLAGLALAFLVSPALAGGIPVIDGAHMGQNAMQFAQDIAEQIRQYEQMVQQYEQLQTMYKNMTSGRGLAKMLMDPRFRNYLPEDWKNVYDKVRKMGASGLTGEARAIYDAVKKYDTCKRLTGDYKYTCEARAVKAALDAAYYTRAFDLAKERLNQIEGMLDAAAKSEDQKEILEIQARIQGEQALLQNEATKLKMFEAISQAEEKLMARRQHEMHAQLLFPEDAVDFEPELIEW